MTIFTNHTDRYQPQKSRGAARLASAVCASLSVTARARSTPKRTVDPNRFTQPQRAQSFLTESHALLRTAPAGILTLFVRLSAGASVLAFKMEVSMRHRPARGTQ